MKYRTIIADPPWPLKDMRMRPWCGAGGRRKRATVFPYQTQSIEWIKSLAVADLVEADAHLYLWIPAALNREGRGVDVARAWGFTVVSEMVWDKINFGLGKFPRPQHEIILVCRRGKLPFNLNNVGSVQRWRRPYGMSHGSAGKIHSAKPEGFTDLVERASPGPYLELFARRQRLGWHTWGDEAFNHIDMEAAL